MGIMTSKDVQQFGLLGQNIGLGAIDRHLIPFEQLFARRILGVPFYTILKDDVNVANRDAKAWSKDQSYDTGEVVDFYGVSYASLSDGNTSSPIGVNWEKSARFNTGEYEAFWAGYLRPYMTTAISAKIFPLLPAAGDNGLLITEATDESPRRSATLGEVSARVNTIKDTAGDLLEALFYYVRTKKDEGSALYDKSLIIDNPTSVSKYFLGARRRFYWANQNTPDRLDRARSDRDRDF